MSIRSFIRLNFKEDCFSIIKRVKLNNSTLNWFYFLTQKEVIENELDVCSGGCEKRYLVSVCGNLDGCYSKYPTKVIALFSKAMQQSKISIDYPRSLILKMLRKKECLPCPKDDYKIYFIYSNASSQYSLSAFVHAEDENEAKNKFKAHFLQLKKEHPIKYKELKCRFSVIHLI